MSQGFKIETDQGTQYVSDPMICNGRYWKEAEGKENMEAFSKIGYFVLRCLTH